MLQPRHDRLANVDLSTRLSPESYERKLPRLQGELRELARLAYEHGRPAVLVFEGWDAAGKGGSIRRMTEALDARQFRVVPVAAPTDEERAHHYLWRFWRHVPRDGRITVFDRSWYGRVLVERVEGFAAEAEWRRAYDEINEFELQLVSHGTALVKFWLHLSPEEQLRRFSEREVVPWKQHKLTGEDWRNRERWQDYLAAVNDMLVFTDRRRRTRLARHPGQRQAPRARGGDRGGVRAASRVTRRVETAGRPDPAPRDIRPVAGSFSPAVRRRLRSL